MRLTLSAMILAAMLSSAGAQEDGVAEGRRLADINCTRCHNIEAEGESPLTDAPPFREVAKNYMPDELFDGFMEGLAVRHPLMPDWDMTDEQARAMTAFIMSLKGDEQAKEGDTPIFAGADLLRSNCARCHAIDMASTSPRAEAPPFRVIVTKYEPSDLEEALAEGILTGHNDMPEFTFEPEEIAAIIAYLDTLKAE